MAFNTAFAVWLLLKPMPGELHVAVSNTFEFVGPLIGILWCGPALLRGWRAEGQTANERRAQLCAGLLLSGIACFVAGQSIWTFHEVVLGEPTPFPSIADVAFIAAYPFFFLGVVLLPSRPLPMIARWRILLDSLTTMAALVTFSWYFILAPQLAQGEQTLLGKILGPLYPLGDLALLFCVLMLTGRTTIKGMGRVIGTITLGLVSIIVIDTMFAYGTLHNTYATGGVLDALWSLGYMLVGLAAWQLLTSPMEEPTAAIAPNLIDPNVLPKAPSLLQSLMPYAFMPPAIGLLCFVYGIGDWTMRTWGVYAGAALLGLLVLARQFFVVCENEGLYRKLHQIYAALADNHRSLASANEQLQSLATTDGMTMLTNHRALQERLREKTAASQRSQRPVSLLLLDVDRFKQFNDTFGHPAGDDVLCTVATLMRSAIRGTDLAARYGGEEFAVVLPGAEAEAATTTARRIQMRIAEHEFEHGQITVSIGVACTSIAGTDPNALIRAADRALYDSKAAGRNFVTVAQHAQAA